MVYEGPRDHIDLGILKIKSSVGSKYRSKKDQSLFDEIVASQSLSKEDEVYANQRKTPRAKPKEGKVVRIVIDEGELLLFTLYDLSTGGMSIVTGDINDFSEQEEISVIGFDEKTFEEPVKAIVRSIRDIDDLVGQYKIGIQFLEE
jgi:c-di-GMP-binding flagellar brake protein YcgR